MGRWAQRRRGQTSPRINFITRAVKDPPLMVLLTFATTFDADPLEPANFVSQPSGNPADDITQVGDQNLELTFLASIATDTTIVFTPSVSGFVTPQTLAYV